MAMIGIRYVTEAANKPDANCTMRLNSTEANPEPTTPNVNKIRVGWIFSVTVILGKKSVKSRIIKEIGPVKANVQEVIANDGK